MQQFHLIDALKLQSFDPMFRSNYSVFLLLFFCSLKKTYVMPNVLAFLIRKFLPTTLSPSKYLLFYLRYVHTTKKK